MKDSADTAADLTVAPSEEEVLVFPVSFAQQRLWVLDRLEPNSAFYNMPMPRRLTGVLNVEALEKSLNEIVRRHEALRTTFVMRDEQPVQIVSPNLRVELPLTDLSHLPEDRRVDEARRLASQDAKQPFDLSRGPLFRASVLKLSQQDHVLLLNAHHIVSDGWSQGVLTEELVALYEAFSQDKPSPLPDLKIQYVDFALWQREWLQGEVLDQQVAHWKEQLQGAPPLLEIPTDRPRPPVESFRGDSAKVQISASTSEKLKALSRREGVTLFMALLSAFYVLLSRYSGQEDIVVGTPIANRNRPEIENLIGFFANTLALRTNLSDNPSFRELLSRVREVSLEAYAHQDLPFEKLVEVLRPERSLSHNPLFQVIFALQNQTRATREMTGLKIQPFGAKVGTAKVDLALFMIERSEGLSGSLEYNTDIFDASTIERLILHFQVLLDAISDNPERRISEFPLLAPAERSYLLQDLNATQLDYPSASCVHELFETQAQRTPNALAVIFDQESVTYRALNERANRLAHYLRKRGARPEKLIGIYLERSTEMLVALLGVLKAGAAYVPLDPAYPKDRIAFIAEDAGLELLITQQDLEGKAPPTSAQIIRLDSDWDLIAKEASQAPVSEVSATNLAYVLYTSGSTGKPKGVQIEHRNFVNFLTSMHREPGLSSEDVLLAVTTLSFDIAGLELFLPLTAGARVVLATREEAANGIQLLHRLGSEGVTVMQATPATWRLLIESGWNGNAHLKIFCGGEALPRELAEQLLPRCRELWNMYGPTESTIWSSLYRVTDANWSIAPIGRPIANTQIYLLDKQGQPLPQGVAGELYIGGDGVARGYWNRPELNREKFIPNPFCDQTGTRIYRTGDLARYLPDGNLQYLGRLDNQVKVRGFRIELGEIENALTLHPAVRQAAVIVREDNPGDKRLIAYVIPEGGPLSSDELRIHLKQSLPEYMVPSAFVALESFPLTPNGKVDRKALPAPTAFRPPAEQYVAPRTPVEEAVAGIWAEVLHLNQVGAHDEFFALGGHSLLAAQVMSRITQAFQVEIPLRTLFEASTVAGLSQRIEQARSAERGLLAPPILPVPRDQNLPLSFSQQRLWVLDQLQPENAIYNVSQALRLTGLLDIDVLKRSLNEVLHRHEVLRTTFAMAEEQPVQIIAPEIDLDLPVTNLSDLPRDEREDEARRLANEEAQKPFSLKHAPMLRVKLVRLAPDEHILLVNVHHIVTDGWSLGVFSRDLAAVYRAYSEGKASPLPELPIQYADFAVWQREWLQGEVLERQLAYWKSQLAATPPVLQLPTDRPRPAVESFRGSTTLRVFPLELLQQLKALSRREGVTLFMALLAAFDVLLWRYSGQEDVLVGSPVANRNRTEVEDLIGFFVNTLVFRSDLSGNPSFRELLVRVREVALNAYAHQDLPFEKLVEELRLERNLSYNPLFQVMFALQNAPLGKLHLPNLTLSGFPVSVGRSMFDLTMFMMESERGLLTRLEYNTDLFDAQTIERLLDRLHSLLNAFVSDPDLRIGEAPLLSEVERSHLLEELNSTQSDYPSHSCVHQLFEAQVQRTPNAVAVVFGDKQISYSELNSRANQLARYLQHRGVGPDVLVGVCLERSLEMVVAVLGVLKAGGAYLPIDPAYPKERIAFILQDAKAQILLTQDSLVETLPSTGVDYVKLDSEWPRISAGATQDLQTSVVPQNLAYVIYTSGSTGKPKGVQIEHRGMVNFLCSMRQQPGIYASDIVLAVTTLSFDIAGLELHLPLITGARVVLATHEEAQDGRKLMAKVEDSGITVMQATPASWRLMLESGWHGKPNLKVLCGGEAFPKDLADQLVSGCAEVWNMYGPTETTVWSTLHRVKKNETGPVPIGRPIANTQLFVLDAGRQPVPLGIAGELYIGGDGVSRGYLNRADLTSERFVPHPFDKDPTKRLYRTGDLVRYLPNGSLVFLSRVDTQVKVRGFRIELGEIESVLSEHAGVQQSVVLAREDEPGNQQLVAYVIPTSDSRAVDHRRYEEYRTEHLEEWESAWDQTYHEALSSSVAGFNISGWNSSYSGLPIPQDEMREWTESTVDRIRTLRPKRVLEIGCGTGLLLLRLAPDCRHYHGVDFSQKALESIRQELTRCDQPTRVTLTQMTAHDISKIRGESIDTVILNSVCQYFPDINYLADVLKSAAELIEDEGVIFVGDARNLALLPAFHAAVQLHQAPATLRSRDVLDRIRRRAAQEEELVLDPAFFTALQTRMPRISGVEILLKRGRYNNEMTQFRYDAILRIGKQACAPVDCQWLDWEKTGLTMAEVRRTLQQVKPDILGIKGVPNARVWKAVSALNLLTAEGVPDNIGSLRNALDDGHLNLQVEPEDFYALAEDLPYSASVSWENSGADGYCTVVLRRNGTKWAPAPVPGERIPIAETWSSFANDPIKGAAARNLIPDLRKWLHDRLPNYMVPSAIVALEYFPLTPNGKVDRRSLPAPDTTRQGKMVAPRDDVEQMLVELWQKLLAVQPIGVTDNFFELGGHSLLAVRLMTEVKKATGKLLPLATLFEGATIEYLAGVLRQTHADKGSAHRIVLEIQGKGSNPPFFGIVTPGVNALGYVALARHLGTNQPLYRIQGPGPRVNDRPYSAAEYEDMAAEYVKAMKTVQPSGPYYIGGMCEGARIAFDMARLLDSQGEKVALLGIFDTWVIENSQNRFLWYFYYYNQRLRGLRKLTPRQRAEVMKNSALNFVRRAFHIGKPERSLWPKAYWPGRDFVPAEYRGEITIFKIPKQPFYYRRDPLMGWGDRTTGEVKVVPIVARHNFILREPYVQDLAENLRASLAELHSKATGTISEGTSETAASAGATALEIHSSVARPDVEPTPLDVPGPERHDMQVFPPRTLSGWSTAAATWPLTVQQQRLWLLEQLEHSKAPFHVSFILRLKGNIDRSALASAVASLGSRHSVLYSRISMEHGIPGWTAASSEPAFDHVDVRQFRRAEREEQMQQLAAEVASTKFDLTTGPLIRARLVQMSRDEHALILVSHAIVCDAVSASILVRDLAGIYDSLLEDVAPDLPDPRSCYQDFALAQNLYLASEVAEHDLAYWKRRLNGVSSGLELPADHARPPYPTFCGRRYSFTLDEAETRRLQKFADEQGATVPTVLLTALASIFSRCSGMEDVVVGWENDGRGADTGNAIGVFANVLPFRIDLSGNPNFQEAVQRVVNNEREASKHFMLPFGSLVQKLHVERDLSRNPLFQVLFAYRETPDLNPKFGEAEASLVSLPETTEMFDLSVIVSPVNDTLETSFSYNTDLFDGTTIERMIGHFRVLLGAVQNDPNQAISELPLLTDLEQKQLTADWNGTQLEYPPICVHKLFEAKAAQSGAAPAISSENRTISYNELNSRANQLAHYLQRSGAGRGTLVGLYLERSIEMVIGMMAVLKAGAAYVPLDPAYPADRIAFIVEDSKLELLLTQDRLTQQLPSESAQVVRLDAEWPAIASEPAHNPGSEVSLEDLAYVLYTSGSTGKPKGVQIEHRSLVNFLASMQREPGLRAADSLLAVTTLSFDIAGLEIFLPLMVGARIALATRTQAADGAQLQQLLADGITVMQATPATWRLLVEAGWQGDEKLKILCGGEALPRELAEQLLPRCGELWNMYGPTETTIWSSIYRVRDVNWSMAPIGRPIGNTQMYVLDKQQRLLPVGVAGELYIGGEGVARGYWQRSELTAEKFIVDPFQRGGRLYRTGDLVRYLSDGNIQYLGRLDNQVKVRGFRIELGEIENVLTSHPTVQQAVVTVREDTPGDKRLVGYLIPEGKVASTDELRSHVKQALPEYMVPGAFVVLESLPLTPNGKVDRRALPAPDYSSHSSTAGVAPRDENEQLLLEMWQRILGNAAIGVKDNFFEIGGHSLLAVRLLAEIKATTGMEIPLAALFQEATIEYLANILRGDSGLQATEMVVQIQRKGTRPPFFAMVSPGANALGYLQLARYLGEDQPFYKVQGPGAALVERPYTPDEFDRMAVEYVQALRRVQPYGPYYIGGMCEGARIAFDMARHLDAAGQKVQLLAIFDTWVIENSQNRLLWHFYYGSQRMAALSRLSLSDRVRAMGKTARNVTRRVFRIKTQRAAWSTAYWPGKDFVPKKYGGDISIFKIPKQPFYYVRDPFMGWASRTTAKVKVYNVAARHNLMLREPYVQDLARQLRRCLDGLQEERVPYTREPVANLAHLEGASCSLGQPVAMENIEEATRGSWNESV